MDAEHTSAKAPIEILFASDSGYCPFLATALASILTNAAPDDEFSIHLVDGGLTEDDLQKIEELKKIKDFRLALYRPNLREYLKYLRNDISNFPIVVNARLFAEKYLPETLDKVIYLDADIVVLGSLSELWETDLGDNFVAAVPDPKMRASHRQALGLPDDYRYFFSGGLVINLKKWREERVLEKFLDICLEIKDKIEFPDQDVLNTYASRRSYLPLAGRWTCHPRDFVEGDTVVLHYMGSRHRCPNLPILYKYAALTPYGRLPMQGFWYRVRRGLRRALFIFLCLFLPKKQWRKNLRKRFVLR
ncbi:MAG: glycosyltransferase family 8 protein [Thermoguttaceae bacterium]|nr:glycosyltransferase family 8 protein [Thermoguttaceae bacterium]